MPNPGMNLTSTVLKWEKRLNMTLSPAEWTKIFSNPSKFSKCITKLETPRKILYDQYMTPNKLHHIYKNVPNTCWRGCHQKGDILHICWATILGTIEILL